MRFAYADPPYIGQAKRHYANDPRCAEVNHEVLIGTLEAESDGWALSCTSTSLAILLPLCPAKTRVLAWVKTYTHCYPSWPKYSWEPVLLRGGRNRLKSSPPPFDALYSTPTALHVGMSHMNRQPDGIRGRKPPSFCSWLFDCLGVEPGDELWDVFPGSGIVGRAFEAYTKQAQEHRDLPLFGVIA